MNKKQVIHNLIAEIKQLRATNKRLAEQIDEPDEEYDNGYNYYAQEAANRRIAQAESARREAERQAENARYNHEQYADYMNKANKALEHGDEWGASRYRNSAKWYE